MILHCCGCGEYVEPRLTDGSEIYPHRKDLFDLPFWKCDVCGNFVGCHHKTKNRTNPLGCIPTTEVKNARKHIHALIDPVWSSGRINRRRLYKLIAEGLGRDDYHTANIRSVEEGRDVYRVAKGIIESQL